MVGNPAGFQVVTKVEAISGQGSAGCRPSMTTADALSELPLKILLTIEGDF